MQVTICGGGNGAHTLAGLMSAQPGLRVQVYSPFRNEVEQWQVGVKDRGGIAVVSAAGTLLGRPHRISDAPAAVIPGSQLVLLSLPAFAHSSMLSAIAPHLDDGAWVGGVPARGGLDWCARDVLGKHGKSTVIFGLQTLPWACRIRHYGQEVAILGTKATVDLAAWPSVYASEIATLLGDLVGVPTSGVGNFLSLTLAGTGQIIHPGVMYGLFGDWDGRPYAEAPLFYHNIGDKTAVVLQQLSDEVQSLCRALKDRFPGLDLSAVRPLHEWLCRSYGDAISDPSSLQSSFVTNRGYSGLRAPMCLTADGLVPDFQSRYLAEDIPYGLLVIRGIAELVGLDTPAMDEVITWAQRRIGKEYLINGQLKGRDLSASRVPQRYNINTLEALVLQYL
jgi:hypothetical protein